VEFPRRRRGEGHEPIIPLINIIFLLLIFFLVTGTLRSAELLEIEPPRAHNGGVTDPQLSSVLVASDGRIALDGAILTLAELAPQLAALRQAAPTADAAHLVVRADGRVRSELLLQVMDEIRRAGVSEVSLVTELTSE